LIVTDGAVDLPEWLSDTAQLQSVPGEVWVDGERYSGGNDDFWALLRRGTYPSTTPPTVSALMEAYRHQEFTCAIHVSNDLSATLSRAQEAAARVEAQAPIIDSRSLSVGTGLIVAAVYHADQGSSPRKTVIDLAHTLPDRLHTFALVHDVESLRRSGRIGLLPPNRLRPRPLLLAIRGRAVPLEQPKDRPAALKALLVHLHRSVGPHIGLWALAHGDATDQGSVVTHLSHAFGKPPAFVTSLDPTVGVHIGPESLVLGAISGHLDL
jgi:DegV family protein with EDD domain